MDLQNDDEVETQKNQPWNEAGSMVLAR